MTNIPYLLTKILSAFGGKQRSAFSSKNYWQRRYAKGGNSGPGSYEHLAIFKADVLNRFVDSHNILTVIEFGCGDGNQLRLARYGHYTGYDVSGEAIHTCRAVFVGRPDREFFLIDEYDGRTADLSLSLDVIFHLVEDDVFDMYMNRLFDASNRYVAIYSSNSDDNSSVDAKHVRHRCFTRWIEENRSNWRLIERIRNRYPFDGNSDTTSFSDFYFFAAYT
jgi:hypothetical protein